MTIAQRVWAFIKDGEVKNVIVCKDYSTADALAKNVIGTEAFAVEITQIPTAIGQTYENGFFKDLEGNVIDPLPETEQEVVALRAENEALSQSQSEQDTIIMQLILGGA